MGHKCFPKGYRDPYENYISESIHANMVLIFLKSNVLWIVVMVYIIRGYFIPVCCKGIEPKISLLYILYEAMGSIKTLL